jgi:hypothetical protein
MTSTMTSNGVNGFPTDAAHKKGTDGYSAKLDAQLDSLLSAPPTAAAAAAAANATPDLSPMGADSSPAPGLYGSGRIVDIIRREQRNQMQQARSKGTTTQYHKPAAAAIGSGEAQWGG